MTPVDPSAATDGEPAARPELTGERPAPPVDRGERVLVVGAGPAGLSAAAALSRRGVPWDLVDAGERIGGIWDIERADTPMYASAHFISSKTLSGFPDFPMPEDYPDYPRHDLVLAYIRAFARASGVDRHAELGVRILDAAPESESHAWRVELDSGERRRYGGLVIATGASWHPRLPEVSGTFTGESWHAFHYRSPEQLRGRRVLVVGGGNSGCDIACDAARAARRAWLSVRRGYRFVPKYVFGRPADVFAHGGPRIPAWLEGRVFAFLLDRVLVGDVTRYGLPAPDHRPLVSHPIMNTQVLHHLGHGDLEAVADVSALDGGTVRFADGREEEVDLIVWATGYERIFPFLEGAGAGGRAEALDLYLQVFHRRFPTLAFMGLFETDGAAYGLLGLQAELVAGAFHDRRERADAAVRFDELRTSGRHDLRGGRRYLATERHRYYVHGDTYRRVLARVGRRMGWLQR